MKIINGEIVQDNDPRLRKQQQPQAKTESSSSRIRNLNDSSNDQQNNNNNTNNNNNNQNIQQQTPLDIVAKTLKIDKMFITIPAFPKIGILTSTKIGMIYIILIGILFMVFGYKALLFAIVLFFIYKNSNSE